MNNPSNPTQLSLHWVVQSIPRQQQAPRATPLSGPHEGTTEPVEVLSVEDALAQYLAASRAKGEEVVNLKYAVVFEQTPNNYGAYAPDVPGCVSTGKTWDEIRANIREALSFHIEGMVQNGEPIPEPRMSVTESMAYHCEPLEEHVLESLAEFGESADNLPTTVEMVVIEVVLPQATTSGL